MSGSVDFRAQTRALKRARPTLEGLEGRAVPTVIFGDPMTSLQIGANNSEVQSSVKVELVFWGSGWTASQESTVTTKVQSLLSGPYMDKLSQYGVHHGKLDQTYSIQSSDPPSAFTDDDITGLLETKFQDGTIAIPKSTVTGPSNELYIVLPQVGSTSSGSGDVAALGGRHDTKKDASYKDAQFQPKPFNYSFAWVINPSTGSGTDLTDAGVDQLTDIISHELVEAATDAGPNYQGWQFSTGGYSEIADGFGEQFGYRLGDVYVSPYWSQSDHAFVVPDGNRQKFLVSVPASVVLSYQSGDTTQAINWKLVLYGDQRTVAGSNGQSVLTNDDITVNYALDPGHQIDQIVVTQNGETVQLDRTYFPWDSTHSPTLKEIDINPKSGTNTVDVESNPANVPVKVNLTGSDDTLSVSLNGQNLGNIKAPITYNQSSTTTSTAHLYDAYSPGSHVFSIQQKVVQRDGTDLLKLENNNPGAVVLDGSMYFTATFNVVSTRAPISVTVNGHSGTDQFEVSPTENNLYKVLGPVTLDGEAGSTATLLEVHDEKNPTAKNWSITDSLIGRDGAAPIAYANMAILNIFGGKGSGATYDIMGTSAATTLTALQIKSGSDTINVGAPAAGMLDAIAGPLAIVGDGTDTYALNIHDEACLASRLYHLTDSKFQFTNASGPHPIYYTNMTSLELDGPLFPPTIWHIFSTNAKAPVTINTGSGFGGPSGGPAPNRVDFLPTGFDLSLIHSVSIKSEAPGLPTFVLLEHTAAGTTYTVSDTSLSAAGFPAFAFSYGGVGEIDIVNDGYANPGVPPLPVTKLATSVTVKFNGVPVDGPGS
jgi:hypothetical protein